MKRLTLIDKALLLKKTSLFGALDLDLLLPIADKLTPVEYDEGEAVFDEGEQGNRMFVIVEGRVQLKNDKQSIMLGGEDFFGDESLFNEQPRTYSAISKTHSVLVTLSRTNMLTIISEAPSVAVALLHVYTTASPFRIRMENKHEHS